MHKATIYSVIYISTIFALSWPVSARTIINSEGALVQPGQILGLESSSVPTDELLTDPAADDDDFSDDTTTRDQDNKETPTLIPEISDNLNRTRTQFYDAQQLETRLQQDRPTLIQPQADNNQPPTATRLRLTPNNDRFRITTETNSANPIETLEDEEVIIEEASEHSQLRLRALKQTKTTSEDLAVIEHRRTQALTNLPISIDLETNTMIISTPAGERTVTVLPDQAVQNALAANVLDRIHDSNLKTTIQAGGLDQQDAVIELDSTQNQLRYRIHGTKQHRFFGLFPFTTDLTTYVSAETGEIIETDQSVMSRLLTLLSTEY